MYRVPLAAKAQTSDRGQRRACAEIQESGGGGGGNLLAGAGAGGGVGPGLQPRPEPPGKLFTVRLRARLRQITLRLLSVTKQKSEASRAVLVLFIFESCRTRLGVQEKSATLLSLNRTKLRLQVCKHRGHALVAKPLFAAKEKNVN